MTGRGVVLKGKEAVNTDADKEKWKKLISDHKECVPSFNAFAEIACS